jgi:hypothetical protein
MSTPKHIKAARQEQQRREKEKRQLEKLFQFSKPVKRKEFQPYVPEKTYRRETTEYASLKTTSNVSGSCTKKEQQQYTGTYIMGIATMHKSNLVPVGRGDNPVDYATMRRS